MTTLSIIEDVSEGPWTTKPLGLSTAADALPAGMIWTRIETWIAWRWGVRPATFIVEGGCGSWRAPLHPFVTETTEAWDGETWGAETLSVDPFGGVALGTVSHYRFTGMLGTEDYPPDNVLEAYRRLAEYSAARPGLAGSSSRNIDLGGLKESYERAPTWLARAMSYSGAADLLRPYRRAP